MSPIKIDPSRFHSALFAILSISTCLITTGVTAQTAYKCGNTYSQAPCPGGVAVDASDARSSAQKKQTDMATAQGAKAADALAKDRIAQEKRDLARSANSNTVIGQKDAPPAPAEPQNNAAKKKKKKPAAEYFTAKSPGDGKAVKTKKVKVVKETEKTATAKP